MSHNDFEKTVLLTALIYGNSIRSPVGMSNIRRLIGVCPQVSFYHAVSVQVSISVILLVHNTYTNIEILLQFDILWDALSGEEHLYLFSSIKGLPTTLIKQVRAF